MVSFHLYWHWVVSLVCDCRLVIVFVDWLCSGWILWCWIVLCGVY